MEETTKSLLKKEIDNFVLQIINLDGMLKNNSTVEIEKRLFIARIKVLIKE